MFVLLMAAVMELIGDPRSIRGVPGGHGPIHRAMKNAAKSINMVYQFVMYFFAPLYFVVHRASGRLP